MIYKYSPPGMVARVYVEVPEGVPPQAVCQTVLWDAVKRDVFLIETPDEAAIRFDSAEDEAEQRAEWFKGWDDPKCWLACGVFAIDTLY